MSVAPIALEGRNLGREWVALGSPPALRGDYPPSQWCSELALSVQDWLGGLSEALVSKSSIQCQQWALAGNVFHSPLFK